MRRAGSENARMRGAVMAQRQQQHFDIGRLDAGGAADRAEQERLRLVRHSRQNLTGFRAILWPPQFQEGFAAQFTQKERVGAAPGYP